MIAPSGCVVSREGTYFWTLHMVNNTKRDALFELGTPPRSVRLAAGQRREVAVRWCGGDWLHISTPTLLIRALNGGDPTDAEAAEPVPEDAISTGVGPDGKPEQDVLLSVSGVADYNILVFGNETGEPIRRKANCGNNCLFIWRCGA